jgi:alkylation response protein AidB-like acyl-CoA dehydrogenase
MTSADQIGSLPSYLELTERAAAYLPRVAAGAAARERERDMPYDLIREFGSARLGTFRVPSAWGGPGAAVRDVMEFIIALAAADSNIAQALRPHFGFVEGLIRSAPEEERQRWFPRVLSGDIFGLAHGEIGAANGVIRARLSKSGGEFRANGSKYYSTGSLFADWIKISALDDDGEQVMFVVPRDREGLTLVDDWDGMGQRLTASGTTRLDNVRVTAEEIVAREIPGGSRNHTTASQQLFLAATEAGIARNALADAVWFAQKRSRPIKHSSATRSVDDPYIQHAVGEIAARCYAAEAVVLRAAGAIDRALAPGATPQLLTTASVEVAQAQFLAVEFALRCAELLFDVGGGSATARDHNFDRHWRNARTVANHNPRYHKAGVVGAYRLNGTEPPTTGLF